MKQGSRSWTVCGLRSQLFLAKTETQMRIYSFVAQPEKHLFESFHKDGPSAGH